MASLADIIGFLIIMCRLEDWLKKTILNEKKLYVDRVKEGRELKISKYLKVAKNKRNYLPNKKLYRKK